MDKVIKPIFEKTTNKLCYSPEFLRENNADFDAIHSDRTVIGVEDEHARGIMLKLFSRQNPVIMNLREAEMVKYASNMFLATKISYFNEIHRICQMIGADSCKVAKAAAMDKRIGDYGVFGGKPFGGKCLPKDLDAFLHEHESELLSAVKKINESLIVK
jgi:UDPglucose 6-dehydrogenase